MIVTQEEARTKDCCRGNLAAKCKTTSCMAWQWATKESRKLTSWSCDHSASCKAFKFAPDVLDFDECPECGAEVVRQFEAVPATGYCGLAGRPEVL